MTERWNKFFENCDAFEANWLETAVPHWGFHEVFYGMIRRYCPPPARILDVGCGPGWSALYLSSMGYSVTGVDNEPKLVELAQKKADDLGVQARFEVADAFDLSPYYNKFDLVFSCGVLEHFDREVTVSLLKEQSKCASNVLVEIPTAFTRYTGQITDERIYSLSELAKIVSDAGIHETVRFGFGELNATHLHQLIRQLLPRFLWRLLRNNGYCYAIAVLGQRA